METPERNEDSIERGVQNAIPKIDLTVDDLDFSQPLDWKTKQVQENSKFYLLSYKQKSKTSDTVHETIFAKLCRKNDGSFSVYYSIFPVDSVMEIIKLKWADTLGGEDILLLPENEMTQGQREWYGEYLRHSVDENIEKPSTKAAPLRKPIAKFQFKTDKPEKPFLIMKKNNLETRGYFPKKNGSGEKKSYFS